MRKNELNIAQMKYMQLPFGKAFSRRNFNWNFAGLRTPPGGLSYLKVAERSADLSRARKFRTFLPMTVLAALLEIRV